MNIKFKKNQQELSLDYYKIRQSHIRVYFAHVDLPIWHYHVKINILCGCELKGG